MDDVLHVRTNGGQLVSHHLEFTAGVIANELARCQMLDFKNAWSSIAKDGLCTMDPEIGRWIRLCLNRETGCNTTKNTLPFKELVRYVVPQADRYLKRKTCTSEDAAMVTELVQALLRSMF